MSAIELKSLVKMFIKEHMPIEVVRTGAESPLRHSVLLELNDLICAQDWFSGMLENCVSIMQVMLQEITINGRQLKMTLKPMKWMEMLRKTMK